MIMNRIDYQIAEQEKAYWESKIVCNCKPKKVMYFLAHSDSCVWRIEKLKIDKKIYDESVIKFPEVK